ncbi:uncharacterized protein LOC117808869 [Notolabrus celidotus]|uniref:uncharacterized protein LOC117808869 n=1 Tax=Notolabrus celidotus TaxID=1203425 RepID=UPI0014900585|nr:uncharacterized protein LOC117808869 [Notolabrus celidotus]
MTPLLLPLLLLSAAPNTESTSSEGSAGLKFIVAFPENIASFHPSPPENKIYITSLSDGTSVNVQSNGYQNQTVLEKRQTRMFTFDEKHELKKSEFSNLTLIIESQNKFTVHAVSSKTSSVQTALVIPTDQLGTKYFIPPVPTIKGTTEENDVDVTERQPFKLTIINTDRDNQVTVEADSTKTLSLEPYQVAQVFITDDTYRAVKADHPVAVIFGHTCAIRLDCSCGLLYTMLPPANSDTLKFYIPPAVAEDAEDETYILLSREGSTKRERFDPDHPLVETAGAAVLFRPGLLLNLIPKTEFAACYVINTLQDVENFAVIVVHKDHSQGVHIGKSNLKDSEWDRLPKTDYVSTKVSLSQRQNVIWHNSSTMAVYFQGNQNDTLFGNPATVISKSPDYRGCVLTPEVIQIGEDAKSWQESVKYCEDQGKTLISFPAAAHQTQVYGKINQARGLWEVWIGMRRSSLTGEWYWLNKKPVGKTNWAQGEPGTAQDGQCAIMSVQWGFGWSDKDCCARARPVCYKEPELLFHMEGSVQV